MMILVVLYEYQAGPNSSRAQTAAGVSIQEARAWLSFRQSRSGNRGMRRMF